VRAGRVFCGFFSWPFCSKLESEKIAKEGDEEDRGGDVKEGMVMVEMSGGGGEVGKEEIEEPAEEEA